MREATLKLDDDLYGRVLWISQEQNEDINKTFADLIRRGLENREAEEQRFPLFKRGTNHDEIGIEAVRNATEG